MDLTDFNTRSASEVITTLVVTDFDGNEIYTDGVRFEIDFVGAESKQVRERANEMKRAKARKKTTFQSIEEDERDSAELLAAATVGWRGCPPRNGEPFEFSRENAVWLYTFSSMIRRQADEHVTERGNGSKK